MLFVGDPVGAGLVSSLTHPGANVTGTSLMYPDVNGKRLELLREIVPMLRRVANSLEPPERLHRRAFVSLIGRHRRSSARDRCGCSARPHCDVFSTSDYVKSGGLVAYGPGKRALVGRAANYVDKILKGTNPCRALNRAIDQVRVGDQHQDCESARPNR